MIIVRCTLRTASLQNWSNCGSCLSHLSSSYRPTSGFSMRKGTPIESYSYTFPPLFTFPLSLLISIHSSSFILYWIYILLLTTKGSEMGVPHLLYSVLCGPNYVCWSVHLWIPFEFQGIYYISTYYISIYII